MTLIRYFIVAMAIMFLYSLYHRYFAPITFCKNLTCEQKELYGCIPCIDEPDPQVKEFKKWQ